MTKKKKSADKEFSFEDSFEELQNIVSKLETGNLSLGDSLKSYEQGIKRLQDCYSALNDAELTIRKLAKIDDNGNLVTLEFDGESNIEDNSEDQEPSPSKRKRRINKPTDDNALF